MLKLAMAFMLTFSLFACPPIDLNNRDIDGMPFCPSQVSETSAWAVFNCAINQANSFHVPTAAEKASMMTLLTIHKTVVADGPSAATTVQMLAAATELNLQLCRVSQNLLGAKDSFLLAYVIPGVRDYSGPFLMLREIKPSKIIIIGPHDDSDGTYADTKKGLSDSHALATISDGHKRGNIKSGGGDIGTGDFVHETNNLGTFVVDQFTGLFPNSIVLQIHGMQNDTKVLYRSHNDMLGKVFEAAIIANSKIDLFGALNASFTIDSLVHTDFYLKTEMPAHLHEVNQKIIAKIALAIEEQSWGW